MCKITWTYLDIASFDVFQVVFFEIQKAVRIRNISLMDKALQIQHMLIQMITEFHITIAKHVRVLPLTVIHKQFLQHFLTPSVITISNLEIPMITYKLTQRNPKQNKNKARKQPVSFTATQPKSSLNSSISCY